MVAPVTPSVPPIVALPLSVRVAPEPSVMPVPSIVVVLVPEPTLIAVSAVCAPMIHSPPSPSISTLPAVSTQRWRSPAGAPGVTTTWARAQTVAASRATALRKIVRLRFGDVIACRPFGGCSRQFSAWTSGYPPNALFVCRTNRFGASLLGPAYGVGLVQEDARRELSPLFTAGAGCDLPAGLHLPAKC